MSEMNYCLLPTVFGEFRMYDTGDEFVRLISFGDIHDQGICPLLRIHSSCIASEVFGAIDCDCADQLRESMKMMASEGCGIVIHLHQEGRGQGLSNKIRAIGKMQQENIDTAESFVRLGLDLDIRNYSKAIDLLKKFGFSRVRLISNNPRKQKALENENIEVKIVNTNPVIRPENINYLYSKNTKLGHLLPLEIRQGKETPVYFYHSDQPWGEFSNFSSHAICLNGLIWPTVEHYYQAQKFAGSEMEDEIRLAKSPAMAKHLAKANADKYKRQEWQSIKESVMFEGLKAKFTQHPNLGQQLCDTQDRLIAEHTSNDRYWGDGGDGSGQNRLGELLMQLRSEYAREM